MGREEGIFTLLPRTVTALERGDDELFSCVCADVRAFAM